MEREKKIKKNKEEQTGQSRSSIPGYNLSFLFCVPNMIFLSDTFVEISLMKNVERKKMDIYRKEYTGECRFSIPRYLSLSTVYTKYEHLS